MPKVFAGSKDERLLADGAGPKPRLTDSVGALWANTGGHFDRENASALSALERIPTPLDDP